MSLDTYIKQNDATERELSQARDYMSDLKQKGMYGFFKDFYKKPDLENEEKIARRGRSLSLLGDLAKVATQGFASRAGARQFDTINSQVPAYNSRLERIRDAKRNIEEDYQNKSISMIFKDYQMKKAEEAAAAQQQREAGALERKYKHETDMFDKKRNAKKEDDAALEAERQKNREKLAGMKHKNDIAVAKVRQEGKSGNGSSISESLYDSEGSVWTRDRQISDQEAKSIVEAYGSGVKGSRSSWDNVEDYKAQVAQLIKENKVPSEVLESAGFKRVREGSASAPWLQTTTNNAPWVK